ncbi:MAG: CPBP family intramembrane metalloprotease [Clostridiales bacterium]|nr:CPBP family intramembrane metalloprotease [Clostridiales bacterium]
MDKGKVAFLLPLRSFLFLIIYVDISIILGKGLDEITSAWTVIAVVVNIITVALLVFYALKEGKTYKELINYEKGKTKISQIIVMCIIILFVGMGCMYLTAFILYGTIMPPVSVMLAAPLSKPLAVLVFLLLPVTTALAEDGLYLGVGVNGISNKTAAILVPAFFFALQHSFIPTLFDMRYVLYRFFSFLPLTIILCWHYYKKRNPLPIMIGHALIDLATVVLVLSTSMVPGLYESMLEQL